MALDLQAIRREFPLLQDKTYLNNCSYGVLSHRVEAAFNEYLNSRKEWGAQWEHWVERQESLRAVVGRLLDSPAEDVSLSTSLSQSVNSLASSLDWTGDRDTVVVTDFDFPTSSQIWLAQSRRQARVVRARADDSGVHIPLEHFDELIDDRTLIVSVPYVCYRNGVKTDIGPIIEMAHDRGALVFVDAYQAVGSFPISAADTGADFLAGGCLKYLLGTAGLAYMYVRGSLQAPQVPTMTGWFAQENPAAMDIYHNAPASTARRFESGTPNVSALYACAAGIELLLETGLEAVGEQVGHLTGLIAQGAAERGWKLVTPADPARHGALMALASTDAPALVRAMSEENIVVSDRDGNLRVSPHYYNNDDDIQRLFAALDRNANLLRPAD
ncbi:aminotransferase class V-fold PLP-dependent enzyme [Elongatibacter sediminis]|uniref:Aminotransferase class V-fold PLP-dependent enzyme n=1 Tax=Elongatibacter sediminis TaxID=3119006 RepID=A0AAW9RD45_9GAMM